ncbi:hypothetical protein [Pontibacter mangrovi]|uniref:Aminoglycoside phosphotransferase domain-containing protein n=1 Tax=Pontibacter mangrovi TaxID=2589816 RepID=A0A501W6S8_9BACT|nr:hypothetical protein [Pontibacter mangrovi]TPE42517.1 hypothetical protein FJM65_18115 [Pontibacter mangrovi]
MQLLQATSRFFLSYTYIMHVGGKTYKMFSPWGETSRQAELQANQSALSSGFWSDSVVPVSPRSFCLSMPKGKGLGEAHHALANQFMHDGLQRCLAYPRRPVNSFFDLCRLQQLERYGLRKHLIMQAVALLSDTKLPATSAHGDLHIGNMVLLHEQIRLIDWAMYNSKGSFITDYIHYYNYQVAVQQKQSWTVAIQGECGYLLRLSQLLHVKVNLLRLAYAISRIYGEVWQQQKPHLVPAMQIQKYNMVLDKLIKKNDQQCLALSYPYITRKQA